jgi:hypothetical protein
MSLNQPRAFAGKFNDDPKVRVSNLQLTSVPPFQDRAYLSVWVRNFGLRPGLGSRHSDLNGPRLLTCD